MDSDDEDPTMDQESIEKRSKMQSWFQFCDSKVASIEKTWNRKLENPEQEKPAPEPEFSDPFADHE